MDMENPTASSESSDSGASTQSRLEQFLAAGEAPEEDNQDQDNQADAQQASDESEPVDEPETAEESPEYQLSDIAKLLGADESALDVDEEGNVLVKTKIDGVEGKAKFQDILKSYQLQGHVDKQVREAAEIRKAAEQQAQQIQQQMQVQNAMANHMVSLKAMEEKLSMYQNVDWNQWYETDPIEAAKGSHALNQLQNQYVKMHGEAQQAAQQFAYQQEQQFLVRQQAEFDSLIKVLPEWKNKEVRDKDQQDIAQYLTSMGLEPSIFDHRHILIARDAMRYRQSQEGKDKAVKAVRAAPKIIKPGSSQPVNKQAENIKKLHADVRAGKSGSVAELLLAKGIA